MSGKPGQAPITMDDKYDKVLLKAELSGVSKLTANELHTLQVLLKERSARGNRARQLLNG